MGFRVSRGYFRCLTSTAPQDSFPWDPPPAVCRCGTGSISSSHFIRDCPLLSNLRPSVPPDELLYESLHLDSLLSFLTKSNVGFSGEVSFSSSQIVPQEEELDLDTIAFDAL